MNLAKAFTVGHPSTQGMLQQWESEEGVHTPSGSKTPIVMCGWLLKMKREHRKFRSTWNRRWFTVEDGAFHWYKTSSSEQGGRLSLVDITSVRKFEGGEHGNFTFIVHGSDRDVLLRAETANDASRWVRGLTLQIDLVRGGTFQGPPSVKNQRKTVPRVLGDMQEGAGGGGGERGSLGCVGGGTSTATQKKQQQQQQQLEHSHFREINDRIRAIMDDRVDGSTRRNTATVDQGSVPGDRGGVGMDKGWKIWPTKIVPITSPRMTSDRPGTGPDDDSRGNDISDDDDDDGDQRRRTSESRGGRKVRKLSQPPPPKQPPPSYGNGGRRSGRNPPLRSSGNNGGGGAGGRGGGVARKDIDIPRERSGARVEKIVDIEDKPTNHEEDYDVWKQHDEDSSGRGGGDGGRVRIGRRRSSDVDWEGRLPRDRRQGRKSVAGNATATLSLLQPRDELSDDNRDPRQRGKNARQEFQHLSSDESSSGTRADPYMDEFFATARRPSGGTPSSSSSYNTHDNNNIDGGRGYLSVNSSDDDDDDDHDHHYDAVAARTERNKYANNRHKKQGSIEKAYSRLGVGPGYGDITGGGGKGGGFGGMKEGYSGGSITAENSWSSSLGRGSEEDTSSRLGSSRMPSSRSGSRQTSSRPARRYLVEQNKFRQGW